MEGSLFLENNDKLRSRALISCQGNDEPQCWMDLQVYFRLQGQVVPTFEPVVRGDF
jgi:hypothetical protein